MEIMFRKIRRMIETMTDPDQYHTFDLLEEYLFGLLLDSYDPESYEDDDPFIITTTGEIEETAKALFQHFHAGKALAEEMENENLEIDYSVWLAHTVHRLDQMKILESEQAGFESLFFTDDDYSFFFKDTFVEGILELISGTGAVLGYKYDDITGIFTDIGIEIPMLLVGSEAAYIARGEDAEETAYRERLMDDDDLLLW